MDSDEINNLIDQFFARPLHIQSGDGLFQLVSETTHAHRRFGYNTKILKFDINSNQFASFFSLEADCQDFFDQLLAEHILNLQAISKIRMIIQHQMFETPLSTPFIDRRQFDSSIIYKMFFNSLQSKNVKVCVFSIEIYDIFDPNYF